MCSIYGAFGTHIHDMYLKILQHAAQDRGRDGGGVSCARIVHKGIYYDSVIGNWRATPTTEPNTSRPLQPYDGIVHNGTISNDKELGNAPGAIDSEILPHILKPCDSLQDLSSGLSQIKGSYAIAMQTDNDLYLACNYKPLYMLEVDGVVYFSSMKRHFDLIVQTSNSLVAPVKLEPYSAISLATRQKIRLDRKRNNKALVVCSAGLDSTTAAYKLKDEGVDIDLLHFSYGCSATSIELECVQKIAEHLGCRLHVLPIDYSKFTGDSPILTNGEVATGVVGAEYAHEWVPARNLIMLSMAAAFAEAHGYTKICIGNNLEEGGAYPDNEEEFTYLLNEALNYAVNEGGAVQIVSPLGQYMKHEIVNIGLQLGVPFEHTYSCYQGKAKHCGDCGPCFMRKKAFERNGADDPVMT